MSRLDWNWGGDISKSPEEQDFERRKRIQSVAVVLAGLYGHRKGWKGVYAERRAALGWTIVLRMKPKLGEAAEIEALVDRLLPGYTLRFEYAET